jgi:S1-C subfamily serine protease
MVREGDKWSPIWSGSGSVLTADGLILTNNHVVDKSLFEYDALGIALSSRPDQLPEVQYLAEVEATDPALDLAIVRIVSDLDGQPVDLTLAYAVTGNSDDVQIGDRLRILGYPGIGGETITLTEGAVSGFTLERGVAGRAWIKTDATIAGGNSGGLGADIEGHLIGIPTIVTSGSERGQTVDCRPLADTDRDGDIDSQDNCVPVGGFINALRPINLALPLIEAVSAGREYSGGAPGTQQPGGSSDISGASFSNIVFSDGVSDDNQPSQLWYALPATATHVCAFWEYRNMVDGAKWSSFWFFNGALDEGSSISGQPWGGGEAGSWWVCQFNDVGLSPGVYEIVLEVEGEVLATDSVFVGGERVAAELILENQSATAICEVDLSPKGASNWGQNDLGPGEVVEPSGTRRLPLATGEYDMRLLDCERRSLREEFGIVVEADLTYTLQE